MSTKAKPSDLLRKRLAKRTEEQTSLVNNVTPKSLQKTPSQKRSESAKKKCARRAGVKFITAHYPCDCWRCPKVPCGKTVEQCDEKSMVHRCKQCGLAVRHRVQEGDPWEYCPVCTVQVKQ